MIRQGHVLDVLAEMPPESVQTVVTSPPYWGLRDYGIEPSVWGGDPACVHEWGALGPAHHPGQVPDGKAVHIENAVGQNAGSGTLCPCGAWRGSLGLEPTPDLYVEHIVDVFRAVRRVLRKDGTLWLNLGDSYASQGGERTYGSHDGVTGRGDQPGPRISASGLKPKDLCLIPHRVAMALQADGWWLRKTIVWAKTNPMPESVTDRPTSSHEYVFLLARSARYFYDAEAVREPLAESSVQRINQPTFDSQKGGEKDYGNGTNPNRSARKALENFATHRRAPAGWNRAHDRSDLIGRYDGALDEPVVACAAGRNLRDVWTVATEPFPEAHFATFPKALVEPCIKAGTSERGCCPECGAAWVREVERTSNGRSYAVEKSAAKRAAGLATAFSGYDDGSSAPQFQTTGWRPSCAHEAEPVSCVALDPFAGSGTVGVVAARLDREFVGIELNPEYAEMARRRIANWRREYAERPAPRVLDDQAGLFEGAGL